MATGVFDELHRVLDDLHGTPLTCLSPDELGDRAAELDKISRRVDALRAATLAEADRGGVAAYAGLRNMGQYVASRTHSDPAPTRADVRLGRWLDDFTLFADAFAAGKISRRHLVELRKVDNIRVHHAMIRDQEMFIGWVETLEWRQYGNAVGYWLLRNDPDGAEPKDPTVSNRLTINPRKNGRVVGSFDLDPISGAVFTQQLGLAEQRLFHRDSGTGAGAGTRGRSAGQRRVEALLAIFALAAGNTTGATATPLVTLVMSQNVAEDTLARLTQSTPEPFPVDHDDIDGRCELLDGTPIHPKQALVLLALAKIRRQVLNGKSRTLDLGTTTRLFPEYMKTALLVEARGQCQTPGCDAPFTWLQADHIIANTNGGPTATDNGEGQCGPDNRTKRDGPPLADRTPKPHPTTPTSYHHPGPRSGGSARPAQ